MAVVPLNLKNKKPENIMKGSQQQHDEDDEDDFEVVLLEKDAEDDDEESQDDEEDFEDDDEESQNDEESQDNEDDSEEDDDDEEDDENDEEESFQKTKSRENDRIRQLVAEKNEAKKEIKEAKKEAYETKKQAIEIQKATIETQKNLLKQNIESLKGRMIQEQESSTGDAKTMIDLQEKLNNSQMQLSTVENWVPMELPELSDDEINDKDNSQDANDSTSSSFNVDEAPETVQRWIKKNSWFQNPKSTKDRKRLKEAVSYSYILADEGYNLEDKDFFNKIDERLKLLGLANKDSSSVNSKNRSSNDEDADGGRKTKGNKKSKKRNRRKVSQTMQGASRGTSSGKSPKTKVTLSPDQQKIADLYDIPYKEYAEETLKIEDAAKKGKRMVTIFDKNEGN